MNQKAKNTVSPASANGQEFPLSAQQTRLWVLEQLEHTTSPYHLALRLKLQGRLNRQFLHDSLTALFRRHADLRSRFSVENGVPRRMISTAQAPQTTFVDLSYLDRAYAENELRDLTANAVREPFDLENGPLFRAHLVRLAEREHILVLGTHRIVCDPQSSHILLEELVSLYEGFARGHHPSLDATNDDGNAVSHGEMEKPAAADLQYWKEHLAGASATELTSDFPRPPRQSFRANVHRVDFGAELPRKLRQFSQANGVAHFATLASAFACLLFRYTGSEDVVFGTEAAESHSAKIGPFSDSLVLRIDCSGSPTFLELLRRVDKVWSAAQQHQATPFGNIVESMRLQRDLSRNPLFQIMFAVQEATEPKAAVGLSFVPAPVEQSGEVMDVGVTLVERADGLEASFSYSTDLFAQSTIERLGTHLGMLLEAAVSAPDRKIAELPLLTAVERHQVLVEWNATSADYPLNTPLNRFIEDQVERTPETMALIFEREHLTYRELNARANQLAHRLRRLGVGPDVMVGVCAERSVEMVIALLASIKAGGAYVPLDPEYPRERLEVMLQDSNPKVVLTQQRLVERLPSSGRTVICLDREWSTLASEPTSNPTAIVKGKNLAYTIYTSGSTGKPKGVPNVHEGIVNRLLWMQEKYQLTSADRVLQKTPYSFDVSVWEFFWPLMTGACLVVARPDGHRDPAYLVRVICEHKITTMHFVPSMLSTFLAAHGVESCRSLRRVFASGEALPLELQQRFFERLPSGLHNLYGPTEAAVDVTFWDCNPELTRSSVPIGRPVSNTQIYILDRNQQPVPTGVAGELHIGGIQLARGYLNRPDLTAEKFIADPFSDCPGARLYKTGDLARFLADGNIEYLGRLDYQVKLRGFRIELGEIESVLAEADGVRQAVATVREDQPGDKRLVAYLLQTASHPIDLEAVRGHAKAKLPEFMVPSRFVVLEKLPLTTSGKVDRKALPAPQESRDRSVTAPRTEVEGILVVLFKSVLRVESVSVTDDFFDLGGHSLLAAKLLAEIHRALGRQIPLSTLFGGSTPEYLARVVEEGIDLPAEPCAMLIQRGSVNPPFFTIVPPGENPVGYVKLARHMGAEYGVYKLQGPGQALTSRPYTENEMRTLAAQYVEAMRNVQPEGPYYFGGMCDGAHIASRMAHQLDQKGEKVALLAVFDTWVLENSQRHLPWLLHYYSTRVRDLRKMDLRGQLSVTMRGARRQINKALGLDKQRSLWAEAYWPAEDFVAPTFRGRATVFKRARQPYYYVQDPQMGWGSRALEGVDLEVLPIDHEQILHEPHVRILAERLAQCLKRCYEASAAAQDSVEAEPSLK